MKISIKRISRISNNLIFELNRTFIKGEPDGKSGEWDLTNAKKFVKNSDNIFLLAYVDSRIAGMITAYKLQRMDNKKAEIFFYEIGVNKDFRRLGVGRALIEGLKRISTEFGIDEIFVLTNRSNIPAMKLYESTGAKVSKEHDNELFTYFLK